MLDENLPTFHFHPTSEDPLASVLYFTHNGSEPAAEYIFRRADPSQPASRGKYAVALFDARSPDAVLAEINLDPDWPQPTLSAAEVRAQGGNPAATGPQVPDTFPVYLYNPDQVVTMRFVAGAWNKTESWEFEMPSVSFRVPSKSELDRDRQQHGGGLAVADSVPKITFRWKRDSRLGKDMTCFMTGKNVGGRKSKEPDITVGMFKAGRETAVTIYEPNLNRVEVEDRKGLEVVLLLGAEAIRDLFLAPRPDTFNTAGGGGAPPPVTNGAGAATAAAAVSGRNRVNSRPSPPPAMSGANAPPPHAASSSSVAAAAVPPGGGLASPPARRPATSFADQMAAAAPRLDAETMRLIEEEERKQAERQRRLKKEAERQEKYVRRMVEEEEKADKEERRRRNAEAERQHRLLREQYGVQGQDVGANGGGNPALPPRNGGGPHVQPPPHFPAPPGGLGAPSLPPRPLSAQGGGGGGSSLTSWWRGPAVNAPPPQQQGSFPPGQDGRRRGGSGSGPGSGAAGPVGGGFYNMQNPAASASTFFDRKKVQKKRSMHW